MDNSSRKPAPSLDAASMRRLFSSTALAPNSAWRRGACLRPDQHDRIASTGVYWIPVYEVLEHLGLAL
jgi:hypothetical protein